MIVLFLLSFLPIFNLFIPGLPVTHDGQDHVARIANFYQSLSEGNLVPRWAGNLNWGYGHPILMFLYPLPSYIASFFHSIGFSFVDSTKLIFAASYVASIIFMYLWARRWGQWSGIVAAIFYGFSPYRFVDLYVRGAIGEHAAFVFLPLILLGLDRGSLHLTSLSTAGLILSHNAVSLIFAPVVMFYVIYRRKGFGFVLLGFLLSAFFWFPAFFEGKYTLRDIVTKGEFGERFIPWNWFLNSAWNYGGGSQFTKGLGIAQWLAIVLAVVLRKKIVLAVLLTMFLMTAQSSFIWNTISLLQKFQFPWRFLTLTTFLTATLGAIVIEKMPYKKTVAIILVSTAVLTTAHMWRAKAYQIKPESFYTGIYEGTTDTGESSPIWSVRFMEKNPADEIEIIEGEAKIQKIQRKSTKHEYRIVVEKKSRIVENTLYFPGWNVFVDREPTIVEFQDSNYRGLMTFWLEPGEHSVAVVFGETKLRKFANILSLSGLLILVFIYAKTRIRSASV